MLFGKQVTWHDCLVANESRLRYVNNSDGVISKWKPVYLNLYRC